MDGNRSGASWENLEFYPHWSDDNQVMFPCTLSIRKVFRAFWINLHSIYLFNRQNYDRNGFKQREKIILDLEKAKKKNKKRQTNKKKKYKRNFLLANSLTRMEWWNRGETTMWRFRPSGTCNFILINMSLTILVSDNGSCCNLFSYTLSVCDRQI